MTVYIISFHMQSRRINKNRTGFVVLVIDKTGPAYEIV